MLRRRRPCLIDTLASNTVSNIRMGRKRVFVLRDVVISGAVHAGRLGLGETAILLTDVRRPAEQTGRRKWHIVEGYEREKNTWPWSVPQFVMWLASS